MQVKAKLPWFLEAVPSAGCAKGGIGAYSDSLQRDPQDLSGVAGLHRGVVAASSFRTQYVPLSKQQDFIDALQASIPCGSNQWACLQTRTKANRVPVCPRSALPCCCPGPQGPADMTSHPVQLPCSPSAASVRVTLWALHVGK